jgi:hypothetical protein
MQRRVMLKYGVWLTKPNYGNGAMANHKTVGIWKTDRISKDPGASLYTLQVASHKYDDVQPSVPTPNYNDVQREPSPPTPFHLPVPLPLFPPLCWPPPSPLYASVSLVYCDMGRTHLPSGRVPKRFSRRSRIPLCPSVSPQHSPASIVRLSAAHPALVFRHHYIDRARDREGHCVEA